MALLPHSRALALFFLCINLVLAGSWPNLFRLTKGRVREELLFFDFALAPIAVTLLCDFTLGEYGPDRPNFVENWSSGEPSKFVFAVLGGLALAGANMLMIQSCNMIGLSLAIPISSGLGLVLGSVLSYVIQPKGIKSLLFSGVGLVLAAIIVGSFATRERDRCWAKNGGGAGNARRKPANELENGTSGGKPSSSSVVALVSTTNGTPSDAAVTTTASTVATDSTTNGLRQTSSNPSATESSAAAPATAASQLWRRFAGLAVAVLSGVLIGAWGVLSTLAMKNGNGKLSPYTGLLLFVLGNCTGVLTLGTIFLYWPLTSKPPGALSQWWQMRWWEHALACAGGLAALCPGALMLGFISGSAVGYGIAFAINNVNPLVASLWGILLWREFENTNWLAKALIALMLMAYAGAIVLIALSFLL